MKAARPPRPARSTRPSSPNSSPIVTSAASRPSRSTATPFVSRAWSALSVEDGAATLAAFTIGAIVQSVRFMPEKPKQWIVCGGGRYNTAFHGNAGRHAGRAVDPIESIGLNGNATEAEAFAYLAVRSLTGLHITSRRRRA